MIIIITGASLSEQHTDLAICHKICTNQDLSRIRTSRYLRKLLCGYTCITKLYTKVISRGVRHGASRRTRFRNPLDFKWISDFRMDFWISKWTSRGISGFQANFWISKRISGFQSGFLEGFLGFKRISGFQSGFLDFI